MGVVGISASISNIAKALSHRGPYRSRKDNPVSIRPPTESARNNPHTGNSACEHCAGVKSHETWCISCNLLVRYAFGIVADSRYLTRGDELILHALGVKWHSEDYRGR